MTLRRNRSISSPRVTSSSRSVGALLLIALVRAYQVLISPWLGRVCRFEPSCSRYAVACLEAHGAWRGGLLSIVRLCKCHPFHPGGYDPPPSAARPRASASFPLQP